jgi:competence protein ComEC
LGFGFGESATAFSSAEPRRDFTGTYSQSRHRVNAVVGLSWQNRVRIFLQGQQYLRPCQRPVRFLLLVLLLLPFGCRAPAVHPPQGEGLELHFLAVGKGDAVLIRMPDGRAVVYDGGKDRRALLSALVARNVRSVDLVVASHNHSDHVGGLARVISEYRPRLVLENGLPHSTGRYHEFQAAIEAHGVERMPPVARTIGFGEVKLHIVPPPLIQAWGHNNNSVGVVIEYGKFRASLLGDAEPAQQAWWLENHADVLRSVLVHKASHHGSRKGDTPEMIRLLSPQYVIVATEAGSRYPHRSMVTLYRSVGATVFRTDLHGTVVVRASPTGQVDIRTGRQRIPAGSTRPQPAAVSP